MKLVRLSFAVMLAMAFSLANITWAFEASSLPDTKQTKAGLYLGAEKVPGFLTFQKGKVLFLDVRTPAELTTIGSTSLIDANIPIALPSVEENTLVNNPNFIAQVEAKLATKSLTKSDPVVLMCRSGHRSAAAANVLFDAGFTKVYSVVDGFEGDVAKTGPRTGQRSVNGWKNKGLSWNHSIAKEKLFQPQKKEN